MLRQPFFFVLALVLVTFGQVVAQHFTTLSTSLPNIEGNSVLADFNNDGLLDVVLGGNKSGGGTKNLEVYLNDGDSTFSLLQTLSGIDNNGDISVGDYNNDGYVDIAALSYDSNELGHLVRIYKNTGGTGFTTISTSLTGVAQGSLAWGDYDLDGDLDLLYSGYLVGFTSKHTALARNDGSDTFTEIDPGLPDVGTSSVDWVDFDNDGDLDVLLTGWTGSAAIARIYVNDGTGNLTQLTGSGLTGISSGAASWGDYDSDGDLDLALSGLETSGRARVYRNNGDGTFTSVQNLDFLSYSRLDWADYDNDGDLDIAIKGFTDIGLFGVSSIFRNDAGTFVDLSAGLTGSSGGAAQWGDVDNDGDVDLLLVGAGASKVYSNNIDTTLNDLPEVPTNLDASVYKYSVTLSWDASSDSQTASLGLSYNIKVGTTPGGIDVVSPMADLSTGKRRTTGLGNAFASRTWKLRNLPVGTYYWSVQAVDGVWAGSPFASNGSFSIVSSDPFDSTYAVQIESQRQPAVAATNVQVLQLVARVNGGSGVEATRMKFSVEGTTDTSDLTAARVYATGSSASFSTSVQFGSTVVNPRDTFSVTGSSTLVDGANYFWLVYDVSSASSPSDLIDGQFLELEVEDSTHIPTITDPPGSVSFFEISSSPGSALTFNGTTQYVDVGRTDLHMTSGFTIEAWIKVTSFTSNWQSIVTKGDGAWRVHRNNNTNVLGFGTTGLSNVDLAGTTNINDGQWHHIAAVYTGTEKVLYVDGAVDAQVSVTGSLSTNAYAVQIASNAEMSGRLFNGTMDEIRLWSVARSAAEIRSTMHHKLEGNEPGIVSYWQVNEGSGSTLTDIIGGNNATIENSPSWVSSTIPFGPGSSAAVSASSSSTEENVGAVGLTLSDTFDATTQLVVDQIDAAPNVMPLGLSSVLGDRYFSVRAYDGAGTFGAQISFELSGATFDALDVSMPQRVRLFQRASSSGGEWTFIGTASSVDTTTDVVTFGMELSSFGQFVIVEFAGTLPDSVSGSALTFNGTNEYVDLGSDPASISALSVITVEAWVKPSSFSDVDRVIEKEDEWYLYEGSNDFRFTIHGATGSPNYASSGALTAGQWYHLAATFSGVEMKLYVNGVLKDTRTWFGSIANSTYPLTLAARRSSGGSATNFFAGTIDEVRIWNVVRTQQQINESMHAILSAPQSGLVSYWQLNENTGTTTGDAWGTVDGNLISTPTWTASTASVGEATAQTTTISTSDSEKEIGSFAITLTDAFDNTIAATLSQIPSAPNIIPGSASNVLGSRYFVLNTHSDPGTFGAKLTILFSGATFDPLAEAMPHGVKLYTRSSASDGAWTFVGGATSVNATTGEVVFDTVLTSFSQFVVIEDPSILPVQMSSFIATTSGLSARLSWRTATETDNAGWFIERREIADFGPSTSLGARLRIADYQKLAFVEGHGTSTSPRDYLYEDHTNAPGRYAYRLKQIDKSGAFKYTHEVEIEVGSVPREFTLSQNYPNPFNPSTTVAFSVEADGPVALKVFDLLGREVATIFEGEAQAGRLMTAQFDARSLSTGVYVYRVEANGRSLVRRMTLVK